MNLKNKPPVFVPLEHRQEIERLSKAALMDMVWDYALQIAGVDGGHPQAIKAAMEEFRARREIILAHRQLSLERVHEEGTRCSPRTSNPETHRRYEMGN